MVAGSRVYPWAERLAEAWRQIGIRVLLKGDASKEADEVRIRARDGEDIAVSVLFLDRRKRDVVGGYRCFQEAAASLRAGQPVDFDELVDRTYDYMDRWGFRGPQRVFRNSSRVLEDWLERRNPAALTVFFWHLTEVYAFGEVGMEIVKDSLLVPGIERTPALLRIEASRLIGNARWRLLERLSIDHARELLQEAAALCREIGDPSLAMRVQVLRAAARVEGSEGQSRNGFTVLEYWQRRAKILGDGPLIFEIAETIAYLESWWYDDNAKALATLEAAAAVAENRDLWMPPRLEHLLRLYRARVHPSQETIRPIVDELLALLDRGDGTWLCSLDHLRHLKTTLGAEAYVAQLTSFFGYDNAVRLLVVTRYGRWEDEERRTGMEARERWRENDFDIFRNPLRYFAPGG